MNNYKMRNTWPGDSAAGKGLGVIAPSPLSVPYSVRPLLHWALTELPGLLLPKDQCTTAY